MGKILDHTNDIQSQAHIWILGQQEHSYGTPVNHSRTGQIPCGPANELSLTEFKPVTAGTVKRLLKDLVPTKAPGPDDITPSELKMVADKISSTVSILFNESLSSGLLPTQFKMAKLFPLLKPGKKRYIATIQPQGHIFDLHSVEGHGKNCPWTSHWLPYWMWSVVGGSVRLQKRALMSRPSFDCSGWLVPGKRRKAVHGCCFCWLEQGFRLCTAWSAAADFAKPWSWGNSAEVVPPLSHR